MAKTVQYRFTKGEMDPRLNGRADLEVYYSTVEEMTNAVVIPQGGFTRRPGLEYIDTARETLNQYSTGSITPTAPNGGTAANVNDNDLTTFLTTTTGISTTDPYVVFQFQFASQQTVAFVDIELASLDTGSSDEFRIQHSDDGASWTTISTALTLDTTSRDYRVTLDVACTYIRLAKIGGTDAGAAVATVADCKVWTEDTATISETRLFGFQYEDSADYVLLFSDNNLAIYQNDVLVTNLYSPYTSAQLPYVTMTQDLRTALFFHEDVAPMLLQLVDSIWDFNAATFTNVPFHDYDVTETTTAFTLTMGAKTGYTTATASAAGPFLSTDVGQYIYSGSGAARITRYTSATVVEVIILSEFSTTSAIAAANWTIERGWEALWSSTRGYPRCGTYFQQRLVLGGFKSLPATMAASVIGDPYNFDEGNVAEDDGFVYNLATDDANVIYHLLSHNSLEIYTSEGEFAVNPDKAFTATTTEINRQSRVGTTSLIRPVEMENGGSLFVDKNGRTLNEFIYSDTTISYENKRISLLAGHLMNGPLDASLRRSTSDQECNYYLQVNNDGNLVIACMIIGEEIIAFAEQETDGDFKNVLALDEAMYVVVERVVNSQTYRYLERLKFDRYTDACSYYDVGDLPDPTEVTGLTHLEGESVWTIIDGSVYGPATVSSGAITLETTVTETLEVGLDYDVTVTTNPLEFPGAASFMGSLKTIPIIIVNLYQTAHVLVNGYEPFQQQLGTPSTLDAAPTQWTDRFRMTGFLGWDQNGKITITQTYPLPMTVLNLALNFEVGNK